MSMITIQIPDVGGKTQPNYCEQHVDARFTTGQATAARLLLECLKDKHVCLAGGRHVETTADTVRWLLEQVASAYGLANGVVKSR